jgi:hypothetical protein
VLERVLGEQHDRQLLGALLEAQAAQQREPRLSGEHQVEHHAVG